VAVAQVQQHLLQQLQQCLPATGPRQPQQLPRAQVSLPALRLAHQKQTQGDHQHHRLANLRLARQDLSNHLLVESLHAHQETRSNLHPIREIVALALQSSVVQIALKEHQLLQM